MVKSGLEKIFLKFLHEGDYFPLLHKSAQNHKFSNKNLPAWRDFKIIFFHHHLQAKKCIFVHRFHFEGKNDVQISQVRRVKSRQKMTYIGNFMTHFHRLSGNSLSQDKIMENAVLCIGIRNISLIQITNCLILMYIHTVKMNRIWVYSVHTLAS